MAQSRQTFRVWSDAIRSSETLANRLKLGARELRSFKPRLAACLASGNPQPFKRCAEGTWASVISAARASSRDGPNGMERRPMRYRTFGRTGLQVSELVFGGGWGGGLLIHQDDDTKLKALRRAMEAGINWIDTAPSYGQTRSEQALGWLLGEIESKPHLSTKVRLDTARDCRTSPGRSSAASTRASSACGGSPSTSFCCTTRSNRRRAAVRSPSITSRRERR